MNCHGVRGLVGLALAIAFVGPCIQAAEFSTSDPSLRSSPETPGVPTVRALLQMNRTAEALAQVQSLIADTPGDARLLSLLGDVLFRKSQFAEAREAYQAALKTDPGCARAHWGLGRMALLDSRKPAARDEFALAYQLDSRDPDIILSYADFVRESQARMTLLQNFLIVASPQDRARREDAAARLEIETRLGQRTAAQLASPYRSYHLKLAGYFPSGKAQSGLVVEARINGGKPLRLVLDSGAHGIVLNGKAARTANLERLTKAGVGGLGPGIDAEAEVALAQTVSIADLQWNNCIVVAGRQDLVPGADGVIGTNVFEDFLVRIDPRSQTLDLSPLPDRGDNDHDAGGALRTYRVGHLLLVQGSRAGREGGYFLLDTGASYSSVANDDVLHPADGGVPLRGAQGAIQGKALKADRVNLAGAKLADAHPVAIDLSGVSRAEGVEISGILGYPAISQSVVTINYRDGLIEFPDSGR